MLTKGDGWIRRLLPNGFDDVTPYSGRNTGDFNGDGSDDLLLRHRDGRWTYYPMNGRANIAAERGSGDAARGSRLAVFRASAISMATIRDDVLLRHADGRWRYYPMNGRRARGADRGAPPADAVPGVADRASWRLQRRWSWTDVLVRHVGGAWHYYALDGAEIVSAVSGRAQIATRLDWQLVGVGDFNGNGRHGVLLRHTGNGNWVYYPMNGRRQVTSARGFANLTKTLACNPSPLATSTATAGTTSSCGIRTGGGTTTRCGGRRTIAGRGRVSLPSNLDWGVAAVGDFNGDGRDDLMLRHVNDPGPTTR